MLLPCSPPLLVLPLLLLHIFNNSFFHFPILLLLSFTHTYTHELSTPYTFPHFFPFPPELSRLSSFTFSPRPFSTFATYSFLHYRPLPPTLYYLFPSTPSFPIPSTNIVHFLLHFLSTYFLIPPPSLSCSSLPSTVASFPLLSILPHPLNGLLLIFSSSGSSIPSLSSLFSTIDLWIPVNTVSNPLHPPLLYFFLPS